MTDLGDLRTYRVIVDIEDIGPGSTGQKTSVPVDVMHSRGATTESILEVARSVVLSRNDPTIGDQYKDIIATMSLPVVTGSRIIRSWD